MRIIVIGNDLDTPQLRRAFAEAEFEMECISSKSFAALSEDKKLIAEAAVVGRDHGNHEIFSNRECLENIPVVCAIGAENIASGLFNLEEKENTDCNRYILYGGDRNLKNLLLFLRYKWMMLCEPGTAEMPVYPEPPVEVPFDSIYTPDGRIYQNAEEYLREYEYGYTSYVGILSHRTRWLSGDLEPEMEIKKALNQRGIGVVPVFSTASPDNEMGSLSLDQAVSAFFTKEGHPFIGVMVNFIFFGVARNEGDSLFEKSVSLYDHLDIPVIRPVQSNYLSNEQWEKESAPFQTDVAISYDISEVQGMIEPVFLGGMKEHKIHAVVSERAEKLAGRIAGWLALRQKTNAQKKVTVILNNAVCSGVEATLGRASGLDAFESVVQVLRELKNAGYHTGEIPEDGETLRELFFEKKAYSDFRWTSVEDICACGGAVYKMSAKQYLSIFEKLPEDARKKVENTWGTAPGEAMVADGEIIVTGMQFGNVLLMIQPKRGCYGAKCTGEVCKILQDPSCPPTHQFLASYFYAEHIFRTDAWIHFGTHGCLEYLPGKANGLSGSCFSDIAVGEKPNFYIFNAASIASAMLAKRRTYAVIIDHTPLKEGLYILQKTEIDALLRGLNGGFIVPGEGGAQEDCPEVGRNLYGVQLDRIPSAEAYQRGSQAAEDMVARYLEEEGRYPEQIVLNMISLDIPRTNGEQFSLFLRLTGVRPVWNERGVVTDMELIPLQELGRPRMDTAAHISGVLRDTWPEILIRMDEAILLAATADESAEENYIIRNLKNASVKAENISRIFGGAPGVYANAISLAIKASAWKDEKDLGRYFIDSSSYVYGKNKHGKKDVAAFLDGVRRTDITCDVISMRHTDAVRSGYSSRIQGGYALAAKSLGIKPEIRSFMGESSTSGISVKTMGEHLNDGLQATFFNEEWKKSRMEQGYDGAADIMCRLQNVFEMQCVNESFSDETLDKLADSYIADETMRQFMEDHNPYAGEECSRRFLELESRGKWNADPALLEKLRRAYLKTEARLEDGLNGLGEIQAGSVDIIADGQIADWKSRLAEADLEIERWKKQNC